MRPHKTLRGHIHYTSSKPGREGVERGREHFTITEYGDGRRTLRAHCEVDDEPNESLWTSEEFAEMQAATRAESERKRQAAWNLLNPTKRSRNSWAAREERAYYTIQTEHRTGSLLYRGKRGWRK